jgi:hypothetical protein
MARKIQRKVEAQPRRSSRGLKGQFVQRQGRYHYSIEEKAEALAHGGIIIGDHSDGTLNIVYPQDEDEFEDYNADDYENEIETEEQDEEWRLEALQRRAENEALRVAARTSNPSPASQMPPPLPQNVSRPLTTRTVQIAEDLIRPSQSHR